MCQSDPVFGAPLVKRRITISSGSTSSGKDVDSLPASLFCKSTAYRRDLYSISQILSRKVAHMEENADCFWKAKKVNFFTILKS